MDFDDDVLMPTVCIVRNDMMKRYNCSAYSYNHIFSHFSGDIHDRKRQQSFVSLSMITVSLATYKMLQTNIISPKSPRYYRLTSLRLKYIQSDYINYSNNNPKYIHM